VGPDVEGGDGIGRGMGTHAAIARRGVGLGFAVWGSVADTGGVAISLPYRGAGTGEVQAQV
jgi:hypothetical protein